MCGLRAVARARADFQALTAIASSLSTSIDTVAPLVASQAAQLKDLQKANRTLQASVAGFQAQQLSDARGPGPDGVRVIPIREGHAMDELRTMAMAIMEKPKAAVVGATPEGQLLVATSEDSGRDAGAAYREAMQRYGGKGGGSPRLAQGSLPKDKIGEAWDLIRGALERGQ